MKILVTGTAGFIGFHTALRLLERGDEVVGIDSINDYYDVNVKFGRLKKAGIDPKKAEMGERVQSSVYSAYRFIRVNLENRQAVEALFMKERFDRVCHLAAQAGVRYSITNPYAYIDSNIIGFQNILEACRHNNIRHLVYASSSSVYGLNENYPFSTHDNVDHHCTRQPKRRTSLWPIHTVTCMDYRQQGFAFSLSTARGAGPIWPCLSSQRRYSKTCLLMYLTTET